ncbi:MAG: leucine-rich repeat protein [Verrucomicrobiota bacterium]
MLLPAVVQAQFTFTTNNGAITITKYTGSSGVVTIPGAIKGLPVTRIGNRAFSGTRVTQVLIPDSVIEIGQRAFFRCALLTNVTLGSNVASIDDWAFGSCPKLMSVCCRGNAPRLRGPNVFQGSLTTIYYLSGATGWRTLFDNHPAVLWNPEVPFNYTTNNGTITITGYTGSSGTVSIPSSINFLPVTSIGDWAFYSTFPNKVLNVMIPDSVTNIGNAAFYSCTSLTNITIPSSVTSIGDYAFYGCTSLASVTMPNSVTNIGAHLNF